MTAPCWKCGDNRPCDLQFCGLKEDDAMKPEPMSDEQVRAIFKQCERAGGYLDVQDVARAIIAARDAQWQAAVDAAVMQERERIADWYSVTGWLLDEDDIPDAIRARTKEKT